MPKHDDYSTVRVLFKLGAAVNILGTALVTKGFTDVAALEAQQPDVFSPPSIVLILLWGLAYLSAASKFEHMPLMCLVFCLEKVLYTGLWLVWMSANADKLPGLLSSDFLTGFFFSSYGVNDGLFALVFAHAAFTAWSRRVAKSARD